MSDMLSKEHYCYKIYKSIINKKQCLPPPPLSNKFLQENLDPPFLWLFKNPNPL